MNRISAAEHHLVEFDETVWALISYVESGDETILMEARPGEPLSYTAEFASSRRLPATGSLPLDYVWQVVVGWSNDDDAWHLGLLLATDLATARGSRWCELARWPDPDPMVFEELAQQAGKGLAMVLACPLNVISPQYVAPKKMGEEPPPLPELPVDLGEWSLDRSGRGYLQLVRSPKWVRGRTLRIAWYVFWLIVYVALSVLTITSGLALPNAGTMLPEPDLLPYMGLGVAVILIGMIGYVVWEIRNKPDRIVIDGEKRRIVALRGKNRRWQKNGADLDGIYVTQIVNRRGESHTVYEDAFNFHLNDGSFLPLFHIEKKREYEEIVRNSDEPLDEGVMPLSRFDIETDTHAIGLIVSEELGGLPCYYDRRTR